MPDELTPRERGRRLQKLVDELGVTLGVVLGGLVVSPGGDEVKLGSTNHREMMIDAVELFDRWKIMGELPDA